MTLAEKFGYLNTARHFFSDLFTNLHPNNVLADLIVVSVNDITREFLDQYGIEAVIWDVDGTLMRYYGKAVDDSIKDAFDALTVDKRLKHIILSNSGEERFQELGRIFPEISVLRMYESNPSIVKRKIYQHKETFTLEPKDDNQFYVSYISEDDAKQKNSGVSKEVLGAKTKKLKLLEKYYINLKSDLLKAGGFLNKNNLKDFSKKNKIGKDLGVRGTFADIAQSAAHFFKINNSLKGKSFLEE